MCIKISQTIRMLCKIDNFRFSLLTGYLIFSRTPPKTAPTSINGHATARRRWTSRRRPSTSSRRGLRTATRRLPRAVGLRTGGAMAVMGMYGRGRREGGDWEARESTDGDADAWIELAQYRHRAWTHGERRRDMAIHACAWWIWGTPRADRTRTGSLCAPCACLPPRACQLCAEIKAL